MANPINPTPKNRKPRYPQSQIIAALQATDGMVYLAAERLGCHPDTIYERAKKEKPIARAIEQSRGRAVDIAESALKRATLAGEAWAVCFTLKTIGKHRGYVERIEHEHRNADAAIERELARLGLRGQAEAITEASSDSYTIH